MITVGASAYPRIIDFRRMAEIARSVGALLLAAIATSIDAAAAGLTLELFRPPVLLSCAVIGGVTLALCAPAYWFAARIGPALGKRAEVFGYVLLFDMELVRDVHRSHTRTRLLASMIALCHELGIVSLAEGIETPEELERLTSLGCDLSQGYLLARPGPLRSSTPS